MTTTKELFLKDKDLRNQLIAVVKQDWFLKCMAYAKAEMIDSHTLTTDQLMGAKALEHALLTISDTPDPDMPTPTAGLNYGFDLPINKKDKPK